MSTINDILILAGNNGLQLKDDVQINETGLDFKVINAFDDSGREWILRIPRRADVLPKSVLERKILELVQKHLKTTVPNWRIFSNELIAYPKILGEPAAEFDPKENQTKWIIKDQNAYEQEFAAILAQIHSISPQDAEAIGLLPSDPKKVKAILRADIDFICEHIDVAEKHLAEWEKWLREDSWPPFTVFVHGDLHQGHHLLDPAGTIQGVIDWTEAHIDDPSVDFIFHYMAFGEEGLKRLLRLYEQAGGRLWDKVVEHTIQRSNAFNIVFACYALRSQQDHLIEKAKELLT